MKKLVASVLAALCINALALDATTLITPSPLGIVIAVNAYFKDQKKVYYIRVEAQAADFESAKKQAFRLASEQVAGTVVLSESELRDSNLTRDEVITYSSGLIDEYKIINRTDGAGVVKLTMDIWITESLMAQRLLAKSVTERKINGNMMSVRLDSILEEQTRGDDILRAVLRDYPRRSYIVKVTSSKAELDTSRNVNVIVDWDLAWDKQYTNAFAEAAKTTGHKSCTTWSCPTVASRIQGYTFSDTVKSKMVEQYFNETGAVVAVELQDIHGQPVARTCDVLHGWNRTTPMLSYSSWLTQLNVDQKLRGTAVLSVGQNTAKLDTIQVQVVTKAQCRTL